MAERFTVVLPQVHIKVIPKLGTVMLNSKIAFQTRPGKLLWFRRMEMSYGTRDTTIECSAQPVFYGAGIENADGQHFVKIFEDGTVRL